MFKLLYSGNCIREASYVPRPDVDEETLAPEPEPAITDETFLKKKDLR